MRQVALAVGVSLVVAGCGAPGRAAGAPVGAGQGSVQAAAAGYASARAGLPAAQSTARGWDMAAALARVEGTAYEAGYMLGDWSYTFYAPSRRDEALLVIWDGATTRSFKIHKDPAARPIFGGVFEVDSKQAVAIAEKNGLKSHKVQRFELSEANSQLRLQWTLMTPEGEFAIDGHTGQLLKTPGAGTLARQTADPPIQ